MSGGLPWDDSAADPLSDMRKILQAGSGRVVLGGVDITPYIKTAGGDEPFHPADRRTFRLTGKPKHYVQVNGRLRLRDGESPWS